MKHCCCMIKSIFLYDKRKLIFIRWIGEFTIKNCVQRYITDCSYNFRIFILAFHYPKQQILDCVALLFSIFNFWGRYDHLGDNFSVEVYHLDIPPKIFNGTAILLFRKILVLVQMKNVFHTFIFNWQSFFDKVSP